MICGKWEGRGAQRKEGFLLIEGARSACIWTDGRDLVGETVEEGVYPTNAVSL